MDINLDPNDRRCQTCAEGRREDKFPRCNDCMRQSLTAGLCKWCGVEPRLPKAPGYKQSDYCEKCSSSVFAHMQRQQEKLPPGATAKYRSKDHKERVRDTKFGTGR